MAEHYRNIINRIDDMALTESRELREIFEHDAAEEQQRIARIARNCFLKLGDMGVREISPFIEFKEDSDNE
jgi:hypothetical protein